MGRTAWSDVTRSLVEVAAGRAPADMVIRNGRWVCVQTGEILPGTDVAIRGGRIAFVGAEAGHTIGPRTRLIDAADRYLVPGLLDGHMHVESGMLTVTEFVRAVLPHGTTGMFIDPHEIANVLGLDGVRMMVDEAAAQPVHVWVQVPSCVPPAPGLETPGALIGPAEVAEALTWPGVIGLGEVMNFRGVVAGDRQMHDEMAEARRAHKVIGGHYASPDLGPAFHAYVAGGPQDDHEGTRLEDAVARARQGMKVMLRQGSAWHDVAAQVAAVTEQGLDPRHFLLVTDDCHSGTLVHEGHVDRVVREAIRCGLPPMTAIQMATLNTAEHFGVAEDVGQIAPGRFADILVTADLTTLKPDLVFARGALAVEQGRLRLETVPFSYPARARASVRLARPLTAADFGLRAAEPGPVQANVIGVIENQAPTRHLRLTLPVEAGQVRADPARDLAKAALVERHHGSGRVQVGLVQGFGLRGRCAFASTVAHDTHHLIVVGTEEGCMARAGNELARVGGGQVVVRDDEVLALLELPLAGLMSDAPAEVVAARAEAILAALRACGCHMNNGNMQLSLLALVVIPELRLSDLGLVDVTRFALIPVLEPAA
ncbi:MAG: adenine deaminase [Chloroflexi bacterium RBG_13_68_17]|nr:MAG: adenine deaminase [Chloroflexi bacterium RBG_13_68_17]